MSADATQLEQLFQNFIGNAVKFRADEQPRVHVTAQADGDDWIFSVRDNGIGIDSKNNDYIFVVFHRLDTEGKFPGTGIGLAVCKRIVERHGGEYHEPVIDTDAGRLGFRLSFPVSEARMER